MRLSLPKEFFIACCMAARGRPHHNTHPRLAPEKEKVKIWDSELTHLEDAYEAMVKKKEIAPEKEEEIVAKLQQLKEHLEENYLSKMDQPGKKAVKKKAASRAKKKK